MLAKSCSLFIYYQKVPVGGPGTWLTEGVYSPKVEIDYHYDSYPQSPLQDSRLFGPRPWKVSATTYKKIGSWATQTLAKIFLWRILWWRPGIYIYIYIYIYYSGPHSSVVSARAQVAEALGSSPAETVRGHTTKTGWRAEWVRGQSTQSLWRITCPPPEQTPSTCREDPLGQKKENIYIYIYIIYIYICIVYIYIYVYIYMCVYIIICICRPRLQRPRPARRARPRARSYYYYYY